MIQKYNIILLINYYKLGVLKYKHTSSNKNIYSSTWLNSLYDIFKGNYSKKLCFSNLVNVRIYEQSRIVRTNKTEINYETDVTKGQEH